MKDKIIKLLNSKLLFAFVLNILIMLLCIQLTSFSYDSKKDFYNSLYICQNHFYFGSYVNYILSTLVGSVQYVFMNFNCFVLAQVLLSCIAFTSITFVFADKFNKIKSLLFTSLIIILFATNHYADIHSNKTSALLLTAGFILVLNAIRNKKYNLPCWIGVTEIAFGSFFNFKYFFVSFAFAVAFFIGDMISKKKYKFPLRKFFWYFRPYLLMFAFVVLVTIVLNNYSYSVNQSTQETSDYYEYSQLVDSIDTLPYPDFTKYKDEFNTVGINTENEYELLKNGYYDKHKSLNLNALRLVSELQQTDNSKTIFYAISNTFEDIGYHIASFDNYFIIYFVFIVISVLYIMLHKNRFAFFPIFYIIFGFISSVVIHYFFIGKSYNIYGIWLMMVVFLLYSIDFEKLRSFNFSYYGKFKSHYTIISLAFLAILFMCNSLIYQSNVNVISKKSIPQSLYYEIDRHPERYYVIDPVSFDEFIKYTENYMHPLWGFRKSFLDNVDGFKYFHHDTQLRKRNLSDNIYEAILDGNNIYIIDKNITFKKERYFTNNYAQSNETVIYEQVNELNGYKIYKVNITK